MLFFNYIIMCGKGTKVLFWVAVWYIAGGLVSSMYSQKRGVTLRKDMKEARESGEWSLKVLVDNFVATHANMIDDIKDEVMSEENIEVFNEHKEEVIKLLDSYKAKTGALLRELKRKGETYLEEASRKMNELYNEKVEEINRMKNIAPRKAQELKRKLKATLHEIEAEMEELVKWN